MSGTTKKANLSEAVSLCKSAGVLAGDHDGGEVISVEVVDLYDAGYAQFEELIADSQESERAEILTQWGIALTDNFRLKGTSRDSEIALFESANSKFETALLTTVDKAGTIQYHWGDLLLTKGKKEKSWGQNDQALQSFSQAGGKFSEAFSTKHSVEPLQAWITALSEQSKLADGNQRMWFESQISEKTKWLEKLKNGEAIDLPKQELSPQEKLKKGNAEKEQGNDFFKKQDWTGALKHYHNALNYANGLYGLPPQEDKALKELKTSTYNNMSVVHMKQGKNDRAIADLKLVLELDGNNVKALFRRGKLWLVIGDVDKARSDLEKAKELDPSNKEILQEMVVLERKEKEQQAKAKNFYSKMFS